MQTPMQSTMNDDSSRDHWARSIYLGESFRQLALLLLLLLLILVLGLQVATDTVKPLAKSKPI